MKKLVKKTAAMVSAAALALSMAACGGSDSGDGGKSSDSGDDVVTLTIWNTEVTTPGVQTNEIAKYIEEKLGIRMEIIQGDAQKFSVLSAGGDLPDIIYTNPAQQNVSYNSLITSGQIIPLDDLIDEYGENIKKNLPNRLEYSKKFASNGEDKIYYIPVLGYEEDAENPDISYSIENLGLMVRWDVYKAVGCPEIETTDDFLNALKEMQDYANENDLADGKQVYAISGWSDWGLWPWYLANVREMGYLDVANSTLINLETGDVEGAYESDAFWESLEFYNKAYNMGLIDPEAFTMKNDQFNEKCTNGQVLMTYASWESDYFNQDMASKGHEDWAFVKLPSDGYKYIYGITATNAPLGYGNEYANAITTNCENQEKAIQLLDFFNSEEGARLVYSGVEGVHWTNENGVVQPTEEYLENAKADPDYKNSVGINLYNKMCGYQAIQVLSDGYPADLSKSNEQKASNILPAEKDYCDYYGEQTGETYEFPGQVLYGLEQNGEVTGLNNEHIYTNLVQAISEEAQNIVSQCDQYMNVQGVKAIMAADEAEFESAKEEAMQGLENNNYSKATEEIKAAYEQAKADEETFTLQ
ncbi:MAG TPA: hypothetical protein H9914_12220 [Candidatus Blautia avicola]|uniref:ABC transporter substrate-binding protein n=1 Tax=Candidatus Blautia avicola TaxID=2838483 RepID=A0A9D2TY43_9FIRM|nr:hypothetical protein [Candidatus Blautia avicola]